MIEGCELSSVPLITRDIPMATLVRDDDSRHRDDYSLATLRGQPILLLDPHDHPSAAQTRSCLMASSSFKTKDHVCYVSFMLTKHVSQPMR